MSPKGAWLIAVTTLAILLGLTGCAQNGVQVETSPGATRAYESDEVMVNRIAYIDNTGDLMLIAPDGTGESRVTGDFRAGLLSQTLQRGGLIRMADVVAGRRQDCPVPGVSQRADTRPVRAGV